MGNKQVYLDSDNDSLCRCESECEYTQGANEFHHKKCNKCEDKIECDAHCPENLCRECCFNETNKLEPDRVCLTCNKNYYTKTHCNRDLLGSPPDKKFDVICVECFNKRTRELRQNRTRNNNPTSICKLCKKTYTEKTLDKYDSEHCGKCFKIINNALKINDEYLKMKKYFKDNNINL